MKRNRKLVFHHFQKGLNILSEGNIGSSNKHCRFCLESSVPFLTRAHSIPEFLGNKSLYSDDECDICNHYFSVYERELSKFLLPSFFYGFEGKKGPAKTQAVGGAEGSRVDGKFNFKLTRNHGEKISLFFRGRNSNLVKSYKALIKMVLSVCPENYLGELEDYRKWLMSGESFDSLVQEPLVMIGTGMPLVTETSFIDASLERYELDRDLFFIFRIHANNLILNVYLGHSIEKKIKNVRVVPAQNKEEERHFQFLNFRTCHSKQNLRFHINLPNNNLR